MLKLAFEFLTESYSLLENPASNHIIMAVVGILAFVIAYSIVGFLYDADMIDGSMIGHILHWVIRLVVFLVIYYAAATILRIYRWIKSVPAYVWWMALVVMIVCLISATIKKILCKHRRNN